MRSKIVSLFFIAFLVSCGSGGGSGEKSEGISSDTLTLNTNEERLVEKILEKSVWDQKELLSVIVLNPGTGDNTLRKLDKIIEINCNELSGLCTLSQKEKQ